MENRIINVLFRLNHEISSSTLNQCQPFITSIIVYLLESIYEYKTYTGKFDELVDWSEGCLFAKLVGLQTVLGLNRSNRVNNPMLTTLLVNT